jgi:vitamin B12 transporter
MNLFQRYLYPALIVAPLFAQADTIATEQLIVSATRTEQTIAETLASATVFTRDDIDRYQALNFADLLKRAGGVSVSNNGGRGSSTAISLRGNQTDHTLFLVDGVRIGSSTLGSSPLEMIDPEVIERIEIVRGPKSSLYGSDALGGVVNIITRKADGNAPLTLKTTAGSNHTRKSSANGGFKGDNYSVSFTASSDYTDGYDVTSAQTLTSDDNDAYRKNSLGISGNVNLTEQLRMGVSYQLNKAEAEYDDSCTNATTFATVVCSPYTDNKTEAAHISLDWAVLSQWITSLNIGQSKDQSETLADDINMLTTFSGGEFNTEKTDLNWLNTITLSEQLLLSLGYDYLNEEVSGTTNYDLDERDNHGYFAQLQLHYGPFSANLGARHDDNEQFGSHDTFNVAAGFDLPADLKIIASYGEAFKAPTFNDLYFPNFGDPSLVPEESKAYELALRGNGDSYNWSLSAYKNKIDNLIQYNPNIFAVDQINSATIKGLEAAFEIDIAGWIINTSLSVIDTADDLSGNELPRRPEQTLSLDIDRSFGKLSLGTTLYAASSRFNDPANQSELSGYGTVALRAAYNLNEQWAFQLKADNLFEKDYVISQASTFTGLGDYRQPSLEVLFSVVYTPNF